MFLLERPFFGGVGISNGKPLEWMGSEGMSEVRLWMGGRVVCCGVVTYDVCTLMIEYAETRCCSKIEDVLVILYYTKRAVISKWLVV